MTKETDKGSKDELPALVDQIDDAGHADKPVTVGDLLDLAGSRAFGPLLLIPALLALGPTGVIPGMPIVTATIIILIAAQILFRQEHPWLPEKALNIKVERRLLRRAARYAKPIANAISRVTRRRLEFAIRPPAIYLVALLSIVLAALFIPLGFVPFGVAIPSFVLTILAIGMTVADGIVVLGALGMGVGAIGGSVWLLS